MHNSTPCFVLCQCINLFNIFPLTSVSVFNRSAIRKISISLAPYIKPANPTKALETRKNAALNEKPPPNFGGGLLVSVVERLNGINFMLDGIIFLNRLYRVDFILTLFCYCIKISTNVK